MNRPTVYNYTLHRVEVDAKLEEKIASHKQIFSNYKPVVDSRRKKLNKFLPSETHDTQPLLLYVSWYPLFCCVEPCCDHDKNIIFSDGVGWGWGGGWPLRVSTPNLQLIALNPLKVMEVEERGIKRDGEMVKGRKDEMRMLAYKKCSGSGSAWNHPLVWLSRIRSQWTRQN